MQVKGRKLEFVSQISRDGSGTVPVSKSYIRMMKDDIFEIRCLSLSERTYIASGFNSFVVRFKTKK
jgi:hypothetical protein